MSLISLSYSEMVVALVLRGGCPEFCEVTVVTQSCGGLCIVGLTAKSALFSWFIFM